MLAEWNAETLMALPGYPWLPCPICRGGEGCCDTVSERARASLPGLVLPHPTAEDGKDG